jgi:hypothetical protein
MNPCQHTLQREKALNSQQTKLTAEKTGLLLQRAEQARTLKIENKKEPNSTSGTKKMLYEIAYAHTAATPYNGRTVGHQRPKPKLNTQKG